MGLGRAYGASQDSFKADSLSELVQMCEVEPLNIIRKREEKTKIILTLHGLQFLVI